MPHLKMFKVRHCLFVYLLGKKSLRLKCITAVIQQASFVIWRKLLITFSI
jgi:hypothetical protein